MLCRVCDRTNLELAVDLGSQPWCNHFLRPHELGTEPFYPLRVLLCLDCGTAQLDYTVPKEVMFSDHTYVSGTTQTLRQHFRRVAEEVNRRIGDRPRTVLDIGSNDGTQLLEFKSLGYDVLGVEPSRGTVALAKKAGVPTVQAYFNEQTARELDRKFQVINAAGVFFHLEELHSAAEGIRICLADDGLFVVQFLYMKRIMENVAFDQIYHEHLLYYHLSTLAQLLRRHGLKLVDAYESAIHGGSMIAFATHAGSRLEPTDQLQQLLAAEEAAQVNAPATYAQFAKNIDTLKARNLAYLDRAQAAGRSVFGMGAPAKGNTLLNYFDVGPERIELLVERNPLRRGLYSPGKHIPIAIEDELARQPDIYYVLAWNFRDEMLVRYRPLIESGIEFYFPIEPGGMQSKLAIS